MSIEIWKPVVGHEGIYEVSDLGRVRSVDRIKHAYRSDMGVHYSRRLKGKLLKPIVRKIGYLQVNLGHNHPHNIHILVLEAFRGPRPDGMQSLHWDNDKANSKLSNLRWGTPLENMEDQRRQGVLRVGELNGRAKLTVQEVRNIRSRRQQGADYPMIAAEFGITRFHARQIGAGLIWRQVR